MRATMPKTDLNEMMMDEEVQQMMDDAEEDRLFNEEDEQTLTYWCARIASRAGCICDFTTMGKEAGIIAAGCTMLIRDTFIILKKLGYSEGMAEGEAEAVIRNVWHVRDAL